MLITACQENPILHVWKNEFQLELSWNFSRSFCAFSHHGTARLSGTAHQQVLRQERRLPYFYVYTVDSGRLIATKQQGDFRGRESISPHQCCGDAVSFSSTSLLFSSLLLPCLFVAR